MKMQDEEFLELIEANRDNFYRFVRRNLWNPHDADDVFSSAVLAAYSGLSKFQVGTNFKAWMYRILINKCFVANRETRVTKTDLATVDEYIAAKEVNDKKYLQDDPQWFIEECGEEVIEAISHLSTMERSCFLLRALEDYSYKEISQILEIPLGTVMTHLSRGRAKLKRILLEYAKEEGIGSLHSKMEKAQEDRRAVNE